MIIVSEVRLYPSWVYLIYLIPVPAILYQYTASVFQYIEIQMQYTWLLD